MPDSSYRMGFLALLLSSLVATAGAADPDPGFTVVPLGGTVSVLAGL